MSYQEEQREEVREKIESEKRKDIKEGIAKILHSQERMRLKYTDIDSPFNAEWKDLSEAFKEKYRDLAEPIILYLCSYGVQI